MGVLQSRAITDRGRILLADVQAGAVFIPTKIVIGSGNIPVGSTAATLTAVVSPVINLEVSKHKKSADGKVVFGGVYTNTTITQEFYFRELALYARAEYRDASGNVTKSVPECLYTYGHFGDTADLMPAYSSSTVVERNIDIVTWVGNETQVELTVQSGVYAPLEEFESHASRHAKSGGDPISPADIGAVSKSGDTITGDLNQRIGGGEGKLTANAYRMAMRHTPNTSAPDEYSLLGVFGDSDLKDAVQLWRKENGVEENYKILHTGNANIIKPSDIGAASEKHASTHAMGGVDRITPASIGAAEQHQIVASKTYIDGGSSLAGTALMSGRLLVIYEE